MYINYGMMI